MPTVHENPNRTSFQRDVSALLRLTLAEARTTWAAQGHDPFTVNPPEAPDAWYVHGAGWSGWDDKCADAPSSALAVWVVAKELEPPQPPVGWSPSGEGVVIGACTWQGILHWTWDDGTVEEVPALADGQPATTTPSAATEVLMDGSDGYHNDPPGGTGYSMPPLNSHAACLVSAGSTYRLTAKIRDEVSGSGFVTLRWLSDSYDGAAREGISTETLNGTGGTNVWSTVSAQYTAPSGAVAVQFGGGGNTHTSELKFEQMA